jgi:hypothetical protein
MDWEKEIDGPVKPTLICAKGEVEQYQIMKEKFMIKILFICHGNILKNLGKAYRTNNFMVWSGIYYTTITPFLKEH